MESRRQDVHCLCWDIRACKNARQEYLGDCPQAGLTWHCNDRCGHVSEETKSADWTSAWGMLMAVFMSVVLGLGYVISLLFSIQVRTPCLALCLCVAA